MKTLLKVLAAMCVIVLMLTTGLVALRAVSREPLLRISLGGPRHSESRHFYERQASSASRDPIPLQDTFRRDEAWYDARWRQHAVLRIGQDYVLKDGDSAREVRVFFGATTIEGHVYGDVFSIFGPVRVSSTAVIDGALVVIGGDATLAAGATVRHELVVVGGVVEAPTGFAPGGEHVVVGAKWLGDWIRAVVPWVVWGLFWGRVIVPSIGWVWGVLGIFFAVYLLVNLLLHTPVRACTEVLKRRPLGSFLAGLLVLLLTGPMSALLVVSVVGVVVVPFALGALVVAWVIGKVAVARWVGASVVAPDDESSRFQAMRSFVIGFAVICLIYMLPVLGLIAWALVGVFGLGAAVLAFMTGLRRENPKPVVVRPPMPPPAPPAPVYYPPAAAPVSYYAEAPPAPAATATPMPDAPAMPSGAAAAYAAGAASAAGVDPSTVDLRLFPRATFLDRLAAFVLDVVLVAIATALLDSRRGVSGDEIWFPFMLAYFVIAWAWKGTTIGGLVCNLRLVRTDGAPLEFAQALVRGVSGILSFGALAIGCLWILRDPERQAWHDKIAGTYVVKVPKHWPIP